MQIKSVNNSYCWIELNFIDRKKNLIDFKILENLTLNEPMTRMSLNEKYKQNSDKNLNWKKNFEIFLKKKEIGKIFY